MPPFPPEELALLAGIHASPRDDLARLVYADWLEEHDQQEYAAFVRLTLSTSPSDRIFLRPPPLSRRWRSPCPKPFRGDGYVRGLPIASVAAHDWQSAEQSLPAASPRLRFNIKAHAPSADFSSPLLLRAEKLTLAALPGETIALDHVARVAESPHRHLIGEIETTQTRASYEVQNAYWLLTHDQPLRRRPKLTRAPRIPWGG